MVGASTVRAGLLSVLAATAIMIDEFGSGHGNEYFDLAINDPMIVTRLAALDQAILLADNSY